MREPQALRRSRSRAKFTLGPKLCRGATPNGSQTKSSGGFECRPGPPPSPSACSGPRASRDGSGGPIESGKKENGHPARCIQITAFIATGRMPGRMPVPLVVCLGGRRVPPTITGSASHSFQYLLDQRRPAKNQSRVNLHEHSAGLDFFTGVSAAHDAADADDRDRSAHL
jgi:hypothetical protein